MKDRQRGGVKSLPVAPVVAELLESLDAEDVGEDEIAESWGEEVRRRLAEVDSGSVTPVSWTEARGRIFAAATGRARRRRD